MQVSEIKAKLPEAEVYHLDPDSRYLFVLNKECVDMRQIEHFILNDAHHTLPDKCAFLVVLGDPANAVRIMEIKETKNG